jgi:hypothetical protein
MTRPGTFQLKKFAGLGLPPRIQAYYDHGLLLRTEVHVQLVNSVSGLLTSKGRNAWRYDWAPEVSADVIDDELCYGYHPQLSEIEKVNRLKKWKALPRVHVALRHVADWAIQPWLWEKDGRWQNCRKPRGGEARLLDGDRFARVHECCSLIQTNKFKWQAQPYRPGCRALFALR